MSEQSFEMIAKTFQGLEETLAQELTSLGADEIQIGRRMVSFCGDKEMMYKANFCLRTAIRILKPIKHFVAKNADEVYEQSNPLGRLFGRRQDFRRRRSRVQRRIPSFQVCLLQSERRYRRLLPGRLQQTPVRTYQQTGRIAEHPHCGNQMHAFP